MSKPRHELKFFINVSDYFSIMNNGDSSAHMQMPSYISNGNSSSESQFADNTSYTSNEEPSSLPNGIDGIMMCVGSGGNSNSADLVWNGYNISNYSAIFDNAIFKSTDSDDYTKILDMIEHLDIMEDIESYLDVDEVLIYFAANTFLYNTTFIVNVFCYNFFSYDS